MEQYETARDNALKNLKIADHMLNVTYDLLKDPKLLISVIENLFLALTNSIGAILYYEQLYKRIPLFRDDFQSKFNLFRSDCVERLGIRKDYLPFIQQIKEVVIAHRKCPVEFVRKDKFVIYNDNQDIRSLDKTIMSEHLHKTRGFVLLMNNLVTKNAGLLRKC